MSRPPVEDTKPWYKQFWPWFLISLPMTAVVASLYTVRLAVNSADGLVVDDYYKKGLGIHQEVSRQRFAQTLGLSATLKFNRETRELRLHLKQGELNQMPPQLVLSLIHPTLAGQDHEIKLTHSGETLYLSRLPEINQADWKLQLSPPNKEWVIRGRMPLPDKAELGRLKAD